MIIFCTGSGAVLHPNKTIYLPITLSPVPNPENLNIIQPHQATRYLGITLGINEIMSNHPNAFTEEITKCGSRLKRWWNRGRTLKGRIQIVRSLIQSILFYKSAIIPLSDTDTQTIAKMLENFILQTMDKKYPYKSIRNSSIKRDWLYVAQEKGGLGYVPVDTIIRTQHLKHETNNIPLYLQPAVELWKLSQHEYCNSPLDLLYTNINGTKYTTNIKKYMPQYWYLGLKRFQQYFHPKPSINQPILVNKYTGSIVNRNPSIFHQHMIQILQAIGLTNIKDFTIETINNNIIWTSYRQIYSKIKRMDKR